MRNPKLLKSKSRKERRKMCSHPIVCVCGVWLHIFVRCRLLMNSLNFSVVIVLFFTAILTYSFRLLYRPAARSRRHSKNLYRMSADIEDIIDLTSVAEDEAEAVKKSSKTISLNSILLDDEFKSGFTEKLLAWYRTNRRSMPWRGDPPESRPITAYGVWISEVMLQQTRVETVIAYWNRWMDRFPDVSTLAAATPEEVCLYAD